MNRIKLLLLLFLSFYRFTLSMEETEELHEAINCFEYFEQLDPEIQKIILIFWVLCEEENDLTTFDKINKSYTKLKSLSRVSKKFKSFEKALMNSYRDALKATLNEYSLEDDMFLFLYLAANPALNSDQNYNRQHILNWLSCKQSKILKSLLILLRLQDINKTEQIILREIWPKFENNDTPLLHLICKYGNLELATYLINPKILAYFVININSLAKNQHTPLMVACSHPNGDNNLKIINLLLIAGADTNITSTNKRRMINRYIKNNDSVSSQITTNIIDLEIHQYTAITLAKKYKFFSAVALIEQYTNGIVK